MNDETEWDEARLRAVFEPLLRAELAELDHLSAATSADRAPVELDQQSVGRLSRMDALQGQAMSQATEERRRQRGALINATLARLECGDFGYCLACGEFIGEKRLHIDPAAASCVACAR